MGAPSVVAVLCKSCPVVVGCNFVRPQLKRLSGCRRIRTKHKSKTHKLARMCRPAPPGGRMEGGGVAARRVLTGQPRASTIHSLPAPRLPSAPCAQPDLTQSRGNRDRRGGAGAPHRSGQQGRQAEPPNPSRAQLPWWRRRRRGGPRPSFPAQHVGGSNKGKCRIARRHRPGGGARPSSAQGSLPPWRTQGTWPSDSCAGPGPASRCFGVAFHVLEYIIQRPCV